MALLLSLAAVSRASVGRVVRVAGDQAVTVGPDQTDRAKAVARSYRQVGRIGLLAVHDQRQAVVGGGGELCDVVLPGLGGSDDPFWAAAVRGRAAAQAACRRSRRFDLVMRAVPPTGGDLVSLTWAGSGGAVLARTAGPAQQPDRRPDHWTPAPAPRGEPPACQQRRSGP